MNLVKYLEIKLHDITDARYHNILSGTVYVFSLRENLRHDETVSRGVLHIAIPIAPAGFL